MADDNKETKGDRISFYIFPPGQSFPWVRVYEHPYGIRGKQVEIDGFNVTKDADPDEVAMVLSTFNFWFSRTFRDMFSKGNR